MGLQQKLLVELSFSPTTSKGRPTATLLPNSVSHDCIHDSNNNDSNHAFQLMLS